MVIGVHSSRPEKGTFVTRAGGKDVSTFYHSPESWTALWDGELFVKGTVKVEAGLVEIERKDLTHISEETKFYLLWWSVTRL